MVNINKVMDLRTLTKPELKGDNESEYVISMDVARSESQSNNQSSISVFKIKRKDGRISKIQLVNLINLKNGLNFKAQTVILKKVKLLYNAKAVVVDGNGLGKGLVDECFEETFDPDDPDISLGCWKSMNTDQEPKKADAEECLYVLVSTSINHEIIVNFIDMIEGQKLQLLEKVSNTGYDVNDLNYFKDNIYPFIQTDALLEEIANLKVETGSNGKLSIKQLTRRVDKDRWASVAYGLYYIKNFEDDGEGNQDVKATDYYFGTTYQPKFR